MSRTYPKAADTDPQVAERERMRAQSRELHEAAQNARDAAGELRTARDELRAARDGAVADFKATAAATIQATLDIMRDDFRKARETLERFEEVVAQKTAEAVKGIEDNQARLAGFKDSTEFARYLVHEIYRALAADPNFTRDVARGLAPAGGRSPEVVVGTAAQIAAYVEAGGDAGLVLDARLGAADDGDGAVVQLGRGAGAGDDEERDARGHAERVPLLVVGHAGDGGVGGADVDDGDVGLGRDGGPLAVDGHDHALGPQQVQRADDGAARHAEGLRELVLGGQAVAERPLAGGPLLADAGRDAGELGAFVTSRTSGHQLSPVQLEQLDSLIGQRNAVRSRLALRLIVPVRGRCLQARPGRGT